MTTTTPDAPVIDLTANDAYGGEHPHAFGIKLGNFSLHTVPPLSAGDGNSLKPIVLPAYCA